MLVYKVALGLIGLGIVVFVHELGHFLAARWMGIAVEAFSIGWGRPILKKKIGAVEYRLGLFPLGGYCKMRGESNFEEAYKNNREGIRAEAGSYFAAHPFRRVVSCAAGPVFNFIFAIFVFSVIWGIGFEVYTLDNRIILASEIDSESQDGFPADEAGFLTGDRIVSIMGKKTETSQDVREIIITHPGEILPVLVDRNGQTLSLSVKPLLDKNTGAGTIGVYFWIEPLVERIAAGSPAEIAGLKSGDRITKANGIDIQYTMTLHKIHSEKPRVLNLEYLRDGQIFTAPLIPVYGETENADLGIIWEAIRYRTPSLSPPYALAKGAAETWKTFAVSLKSLSLLFRGVDLTRAVSGPIRITYMVGDAAAGAFSQGFGAGISSMAEFLSLISIALGIMNLLPLPVLDGGMILLFLAEGIRRKPLNPRFISVFQTVGVVLIAGLLLFAVFGDIRYIAAMFFGKAY
jgi:regulator of sigma E protease